MVLSFARQVSRHFPWATGTLRASFLLGKGGWGAAVAGSTLLLGGVLLEQNRFTQCSDDAWPCRQWVHWGGTSSSTVRVLTWNLLSDQVVKAQTEPYVKDYEDPVSACKWEKRRALIVAEVSTQRPDVIAFQEVSQLMWRNLSADLKDLGYEGVHQGYPYGPSNAEYGIAIFWRMPWKAVATNARKMAEHGDFLATCPPQYQQQPHWALGASLVGPGGRRLAVASMHGQAKGPEQLRIAQALTTLSVALEASEKAGCNPPDVPVIICGDFNTVSDSKMRFQDAIKRWEHYAEGPVTHEYLTKTTGLMDALTHKPGFAKDDRSAFTFAVPPEAPALTGQVIDFMFHTSGLAPIGCLQLDHDATMQGRPLLPHSGYPSDHIHLVCDFAFPHVSPQ